MSLKPIYEKANDQHVASYVMYGDPTDNKLYYDLTAEEPVQVTQADLKHAFETGRALISVTASEVETLYSVVSVTGNVAKIAAVVSNAVALVEYSAAAAV